MLVLLNVSRVAGAAVHRRQLAHVRAEIATLRRELGLEPVEAAPPALRHELPRPKTSRGKPRCAAKTPPTALRTPIMVRQVGLLG